MHYGDKAQRDENRLTVVIYTHKSGRGIEFELTSIQNCQYVSPRLVKNLLNDVQKFFKKNEKTKKLKLEEFWCIFMVEKEAKKASVLKIVDVMNVSDAHDFLKLHPGLI